ncbi:uncharacterized protein LOC132250309 [Alligator mississippiensis]|uniref:uncharacterized protein LOC132250309 n=1 Tax=Alligator mississippiensis TaxID=8496 RepID=UPI002877728F|nr:uncharacterized protein LOC132250309 [Alligator mississippiensis]
MTTAPTETATATTREEIDQPAASSSPVIGPQSAVHATTYYARSRAELQNLCRESRIRSEETLAVWLGRLVVELGSDLLDQEEASFLVRQASWRRGHVTDIDMVAFSVHWPIPIPALVAGVIEQKAHVWHDGRPEHTGAEQLVLAIIGVSYCAWNPRECTLGLTPLQQMRPWPHRHLRDPGTVPVTLDSIDSCLKVYGQRNIVVLRIVLNPLVDHPVSSLLHQLSRLRVLMEPRLSSDRECQRPTEAQNTKHRESERPVLRQRTQEERYVFGFLLQRSGLNKRQLRILGDVGQWQLAYELGFHYLEESDEDSSTISSSC